MPTSVTLGDGTITGVNTLTVSTSTALSGTTSAPTVATGTVDDQIANGYFVKNNGQTPVIDYISSQGYCASLFLSEGKVYSAQLVDATYSDTGTGLNNIAGGRGREGPFGFENIKQIPIPSNSPVIKIGQASYGGSCALLANGELWVWGTNGYGQLGLGNTTAYDTPVLSTTGVVDVYTDPSNCGRAVGSTRLFIKKTDGYIYGAGRNDYGELGDGSVTNRSSWTKLTGLGTDVVQLWNIGTVAGCAIAQKTNGSIWVTGYNAYGALGLGNVTSPISTWTDTGSNWNGGDYSMIIKQVVAGWGQNDNTNAYAYSTTGILMDNGTNTRFVLAGYDGYGQMGNGATTGNISTPYAPTVGAGRIKEVAAQGGSVMSVYCLKEDGTLYVWGYNGLGQLGLGNTTNQTSPVISTTGVTKIFGNGFCNDINGWYGQAFVQKSTGLYGVGNNPSGQLGINNATTPISSWTRVLLPGKAGYNVKFIGRQNLSGAGSLIFFIAENNSIFVSGTNNTRNIGGLFQIDSYLPVKVKLTRGYDQ